MNIKPTLAQGSAQTVRITRFKTDPTDHTISLSILIVKAPNCDFDGDEMNVIIFLDNTIAREFYSLKPEFNIMLVNRPLEISNNISMPKQVISTISNWLDN